MTAPTANKSREATREKVVEAAIRCIRRWGIEKTSLNDIAREAGVTRPTVYSYYASRDDVIGAALLKSAYAFAERMKRHLEKFETPAERLVEAVIFALKQLPHEPYLALITEADLADLVNDQALTSTKGQEICLDIFRTVLAGRHDLFDDLPEIIEFTVRVLLSLLMLAGPFERSDREMRAFLSRRLLPAIGLVE
jgi:AcrR family transcriptional regulator